MELILISASWCTNCVPVKNFIKENNIDVEYIDAEESPDIPAKYGVMTLPSLVDNRNPEEPVIYTGTNQCLQGLNKL
ncbi:hypothetical protein [Staphylococcus phage PMBT8]|nr:hypothetical protein [Staphylococcus phage PMBT8]